MNVMRGNFHKIFNVENYKIVRSSGDYKQVIMAYGIHALANGHTYFNSCFKKMSYDEISNILVDGIGSRNKPFSNIEIIDAARNLSLYGLREDFFARHSS